MSAWKSVEAEFFCAQGNIKTTNFCPESLKMLVQNPVHGNFLYESAHFTGFGCSALLNHIDLYSKENTDDIRSFT